MAGFKAESIPLIVVPSVQTALGNAIGKNDLANLLSERDRLGQEVQEVLDEKTSH